MQKGGGTYWTTTSLVLMAALNEEEGIGPTISELKTYLPNTQILVVDGRSVDRTVEIAKNLDADICYQEGEGKGDAIAHAIKVADYSVDYAIMVDADFTYPTAFLPTMINTLEENPKVGMVCGNRFNSHFHLKGMRNMFYMGNRLLAFTHNMLNGVRMRDPLTGLRVIRWNILKGWKPKSTGFDIEVELNHHVERRGYGIQEIPIPYRPRLGEKKLKVKHGVLILKRMLMESTY